MAGRNRQWAFVRWLAATIVAFGCLVILCTTALVVCILTFGFRKHDYFYLVSRTFGRVYLMMVGVKVRYLDGLPFNERTPRILCFNHTSQLDLYLMASLMPPGGVPIMKKEMARIPILGQVLHLFDAVLVDRENSSAARASLEVAAEQMKTQGLSVGISPEGTRSRDGELGPFKKGVFHLAKNTRLPVHRLYIEGPLALQPMGQWFTFPGEVNISLLPPQATPGEHEDSTAWTHDLRTAYLERMESSGETHV